MKRICQLVLSAMLILFGITFRAQASPAFNHSAQGLDPDPPDHILPLIFIHHSCGENWLADDNGGLALELGRNNYFVSDTNYGWGPDAIGDRTDIPDWLEWFCGPDHDRYLTALFNEHGQNSEYSRQLSDRGGENQVILFKSCFPNSNLEGSPGDPPASEADYSIGGAKYVYNQLLTYFKTRPDKLFVVITAPPVSDPSYAANARDFNNWLVDTWLDENDYPYSNVAIFDFYNVLTGPQNHHRLSGGQIEHTYVAGMNTAYYPTDDDHPSSSGNRKATQEFVPLLNVFYNRWQASMPGQSHQGEVPEATSKGVSPPAQQRAVENNLIDDFERGMLSGTSGWEPAWDASTPTAITCTLASDSAQEGSRALQMKFDAANESWATCGLLFDVLQDWSIGDGLTFFARTTRPDLKFELNVFAEEGGQQESYHAALSLPAESADSWIPLTVQWTDFHRVDWEDNAGESFEKTGRIHGLAFGVITAEGESNDGMIWIDNLRLLESQPVEVQAPAESVESDEATPRPFLPCGAAVMPLLAAVLILSVRRGWPS